MNGLTSPAMDRMEILAAHDDNVPACWICGANPLGHARKREWLRRCLPRGLRYKTAVDSATGKPVGMIEYMPAESAWRAVQARNYLVIHCLQVPKRYAGRGVGSRLIEDCIRDAHEHGLNGVAALATRDGWCADSRVYLKNGFKMLEQATPAFELLAFQLKPAEAPSFGNWRARAQALGRGLFM